MVIRATLFGLDIREVPTTLKPDGRSRPPHLPSWRDGWLHLKILLTFAPVWLFYYPGLSLFGLGTISVAALMFGPVRIDEVTFDIATLILASALVLTGFQMVCFYALSQLFIVRFNLLPTSDRFKRLRSKISVDNACLCCSSPWPSSFCGVGALSRHLAALQQHSASHSCLAFCLLAIWS